MEISTTPDPLWSIVIAHLDVDAVEEGLVELHRFVDALRLVVKL